MPDALQQASLWGQVFEIAVKRGILVQLQAVGWLQSCDPRLSDWQALHVSNVYGALVRAYEATDENVREMLRQTCRHYFVMGFGLGQTLIREYAQRLKPKVYGIKGIFCPLTLPNLEDDRDARQQNELRGFYQGFGLPEPLDSSLLGKGHPAKADFLLWLGHTKGRKADELLCLEFSLNAPPKIADYTSPTAHLEELQRYSCYLDMRGVFSQVTSEVTGESFSLSPHLSQHFTAFTSQDKPLYKLCQGASYIDKTVEHLRRIGLAPKPIGTRVISVTSYGFESLAARYDEMHPDPRTALMATLGESYRNHTKPDDNDEDGLLRSVRNVFTRLSGALPSALRKELKKLRTQPEPGTSFTFQLEESIDGFKNPMHEFTLPEACAAVSDSTELAEYFGEAAPLRIEQALAELLAPGQMVSLRDLHAAAVVAGLQTTRPGRLNVLGLEGNPGIGKTTAVMNYLAALEEGYLFIYISPRVIINKDVSDKLARKKGEPTGILTLTTNSKLNGAAASWYQEQVRTAGWPERYVQSAVVVDGVAELIDPKSATLLVSPEQEEEVERTQTSTGYTKDTLSERKEQVNDVVKAGVLKTLARTTRSLLKANPTITKVVVTGSIQGYKKNQGGSTVDALSDMFENKAASLAGIAERERFAASGFRNILVMVDELTGDGAGGPLVHELTAWLEDEFILPFKDNSPFKVSLLIADASLGNEIVLNRFLNSGERAPDKVLVSESSGNQPFRLAVADVDLHRQRYHALHVMTNSFPAKRLVAEYRIQMEAVSPGVTRDGKPQTFIQALRDQQGEAQLELAVSEITRGLQQGSTQLIYFAQDKAFLREIQNKLTSRDTRPALLESEQVAILDSSVPAAKRKELMTPGFRDGIKVFLMTSSGARGVSFPKTDWIIATMPRFNVESALMELAQLVYRGRGSHYYGDNGEQQTDGDWKSRRVVLLVQEFYPSEEADLRNWLRRASDLLTFLVMIRSTLLTRIKGDAGLDSSRLALVPVGSVGTSELFSLMSQDVAAFLKESDVFVRDSKANRDMVGAIKNAQSSVVELFSNFSLETQDKSANQRSMTRSQDLSELTELASAESSALVVNLQQEPKCALPDHLYCGGPFWAEHWKEGSKSEAYQFERFRQDVVSKTEKLSSLLWAIYKNHQLPGGLRNPAKSIHDILRQNENREAILRDLLTVKNVASPNTWVAVPVDYTRFWQRTDGQKPSLGDEHGSWRDALARCITAGREALPVIAQYDDIPYAAVVGQHDPLNLETVFDDRYFMASQELNLLNTVLLAEAETQGR